MGSPLRRSSFVGGEVSPPVHARVDLQAYASWLKTCRNFIVVPQGGVKNRPGSQLSTETKFSQRVTLVPFVFNQDEAYILEFGDNYVRFIRNGAQVVDELAAPYEIATPHLQDEAREFKGRTAQSADVLFIPHHNHRPVELQRRAETDWTIADIVIAPDIEKPEDWLVVNTATGDTFNPLKSWWYVITAVNALTGGESYASVAKNATINLSSVHPTTITLLTPVPGASGYNIYRGRNFGVYGYIGTMVGDTFYDDGQVPDYTLTPLSDPASLSTIPTLQTPSIRDMDAAPFQNPNFSIRWYYAVSAFGGSGESYASNDWDRTGVLAGINPSPSYHVTVNIAAAIVGAVGYNVYRGTSKTNLGFIGTTATLTFIDTGVTPDYTQQPTFPLPYQAPGAPPTLFDAPGTFPSVAAFMDQRLILAGSDDKPDTLFGSRAGNYRNFGASSPAGDDDAFEFTLAALTVDRIRGLVHSRVLMAFTGSSEWAIKGTRDAALGPSSVDAKAHAHYGSGDLAPLAVGGRVLFAQREGGSVREFRFDFQLDGYTAEDDRSVLAKHMLEGHSIVDWAYAKGPDSVVWLVRDDGVLLGMTYLPQHDVIAWHRHETDGLVESVACIPEGDETAVYVAVKRSVQDIDRRFVERFSSRQIEDISEAVFLDCSLTYRGPDRTNFFLQLTNETGWEADDTATLQIVGPDDGSWVAGSQLVMTDSDGRRYRATLTADMAGSYVIVRFEQPIPVGLRGGFVSGYGGQSWTRALKSFQLQHLIGKVVSALVDGNVVDGLVVDANGIVELPNPGVVVTIGLPYTSEIETLDINLDGRSLQTVKKVVGKVWFEVNASRGLWVGEDASRMREWKQRVVADGAVDMSRATPTATGRDYVAISGGWGLNGRVTLQQRDPLPVEILSVTPEVTFGS